MNEPSDCSRVTFERTPLKYTRSPAISRFLSAVSIANTCAPNLARVTVFSPPPQPRSTIVFPLTVPRRWNAYSRGKTVSSEGRAYRQRSESDIVQILSSVNSLDTFSAPLAHSLDELGEQIENQCP